MQADYQATASPISPEELAQHAKTYSADAQKQRAHAADQLDKELRQLDKIEKQYSRKLLRALETEGGAEANAVKRGLQGVIEERDPTTSAQLTAELVRRHSGLVDKAMAASGIDRTAARRKLLSAIGRPDVPPTGQAVESARASLADVELIDSESLGFSLVTAPPQKPPSPPGPKVVNFAPPFALRNVSTQDGFWATADAGTGEVRAYSVVLWAGSTQTLASVGATFSVDPQVRRVRVEATPDQRYRTEAGAFAGYASMEAKLNLIVRDGVKEVASHRHSLARSISVVLWICEAVGSGPVPLFCEFDRTPGTPGTYSVIVEAETWAGGGGLPLAGGSAFEQALKLENFRALSYT